MQRLGGWDLFVEGRLNSLLTLKHNLLSKLFEINTLNDKDQRGAQLSLKLQAGLLDVVMKELEERGVVIGTARL